jgi:hypothetical protein
MNLSKNNNLAEKLFLQIETELDFCDKNITPTVCYNSSTPELKKTLVQTIAEIVVTQKITISQAIIEVETLYSNNAID